jgi:hypothetical protein
MKQTVTKTEYVFSCDICGKPVPDMHDKWGRYQAGSEIVQKCTVCGCDACPDCRVWISSFQAQKGYFVCIECKSRHQDTLAKVSSNRNAFKSESSQLREKYLEIEQYVLACLKAEHDSEKGSEK